MTPAPHDDDLDDDDPLDLDAALAELRQIDRDTVAMIVFLQSEIDRRRGAIPLSSTLH